MRVHSPKTRPTHSMTYDEHAENNNAPQSYADARSYPAAPWLPRTGSTAFSEIFLTRRKSSTLAILAGGCSESAPTDMFPKAFEEERVRVMKVLGGRTRNVTRPSMQ